MRQSPYPIDINYKPVKKYDETISCYFSEKLNAAFQEIYNGGTKIKHLPAWQFYYCPNYYGSKNIFDCHFENWIGGPSYVYNFNTPKSLNIREKIEIQGRYYLGCIYRFWNFSANDECLDPENRKIFAASYVIILGISSWFGYWLHDYWAQLWSFSRKINKFTQFNLTHKQLDLTIIKCYCR